MVLTTDQVARILGLTPQRIGQLVAEGVIEREEGRFELAAVGAYVQKLRGRAEKTDYSALLTKEKYVALKLENDRAEERIVSKEVLEEALKRVVAVWRATLQEFPDKLKEGLPDMPEAAVRAAQQMVDTCCRTLDDLKIEVAAELAK